MKYKVGDIVKIKDDLNYLKANADWNSSGKMDYLLGQVFTIESVRGGYYRSVEGIENNRDDDDFWYISERMIEPVISDDLEINSIKTFNSIFG